MSGDQSGELGTGFLEKLTWGQVLKMSRRISQMGKRQGKVILGLSYSQREALGM